MCAEVKTSRELGGGPVPFALGVDRLVSERPELLNGRVAVLSHQPAITASGETSAALLRRFLGDRLVKLFGPEHGFFAAGGPGSHVWDARHPQWRIPVISLYGERRYPPRALLADVDVVVVDLHDIGARCYTYLATLRYMLEACAATGVRVVVCDRPLALSGVVDGPMLSDGLGSFVAAANVPMCHGMTQGELALLFKETLDLPVELSVVTMKGYCRGASPGAGWPEWVPPSPGIRTWASSVCYLTTVFTEGLPAIDCGRVSGMAFRVFGVPGLAGASCAALLNEQSLPGVLFVPHRYDAESGLSRGETLDGVRISVQSLKTFRPVTTSVAIIWALQALVPALLWPHEKARPVFFDKLYGTDQVRTRLEAGCPWQRIVDEWADGRRTFLQQRSRVLLYREEG